MRAPRFLTTTGAVPLTAVAVVLAALAGTIARAGDPTSAVLTGAVVAAQGRPGGEPSGGGATAPTAYEVKGSVAGLFPGARLPVAVRIENPYGFAISVRSIEVAAADAGSCSRANVRVDGLPAPVTVPAGGEVVTTLTVRMRNDPPDACKLASFPLTFTSRAVKA
jgi:hypothetical protein